MYFELLALEIHATMAGLKVIKPPYCKGESGVNHRFSFLAEDDNITYGFDIYDDVSQEEVLRTYTKKLDTKAYPFIVSLRGKAKPEVAALADDYGITILGPADIDNFFSWMTVAQKETQSPAGISP
jgi:hypothetical protein